MNNCIAFDFVASRRWFRGSTLDPMTSNRDNSPKVESEPVQSPPSDAVILMADNRFFYFTLVSAILPVMFLMITYHAVLKPKAMSKVASS